MNRSKSPLDISGGILADARRREETMSPLGGRFWDGGFSLGRGREEEEVLGRRGEEEDILSKKGRKKGGGER